MQSLGHPVVGDTLYGAPHIIRALIPDPDLDFKLELSLDRNFLHAAHLSFTHPQTSKPMDIHAPLPAELDTFLSAIRAGLRRVE
jgi:23S rRNA pseudouridine1911/1915/1917 synthase